MSASKKAPAKKKAPAAAGKSRSVKVEALARVEGEGGIVVKVKGKKVESVLFRIFEPPRFFEAFLRGRHYTEPPDITARICGICPVAYQMSSVHALEMACGAKVEGTLRELRRLLYCGEWIESHVLHVAMLHAPDFLGYESAIHMAKDHPDVVKKALELKKVGNEIVSTLGGREIHPVNVRVGGFYRLPTREELRKLEANLIRVRPLAEELLAVAATFTFPEMTRDYEFVALRHPDEYALCEGNIVSSKGLDLPVTEYEKHFVEEHVRHSNALHSRKVDGGAYLVGPAARFTLNFDKLPKALQDLALTVGLKVPCVNPFHSILVRGIEAIWAIDEALRIIGSYKPSGAPYVETVPQDAVGCGCTEAPRGILYHRYRIGKDGLVKEAKIVPPTSQNQKSIEEDLKEFVESNLHLKQEALTWQCEQTVRNYDPCISCATHFLRLEKVDG